MNIQVSSIEYKIEGGNTTSIEVGFEGRDIDSGFLNTRVVLKDSDGDLDDMTRKEIGQVARTKMAGWFTETGE